MILYRFASYSSSSSVIATASAVVGFIIIIDIYIIIYDK